MPFDYAAGDNASENRRRELRPTWFGQGRAKPDVPRMQPRAVRAVPLERRGRHAGCRRVLATNTVGNRIAHNRIAMITVLNTVHVTDS